MADGGYIGYAGASSTEVSVVADIAESLDISGFTPSIAVSSMPALVVSSMVLATPMAVSGTVVTTAPLNQNVSGISLDAIQVSTEATQASTATLQADLGNLSGVLNTIVTTSAVDVVTLPNVTVTSAPTTAVTHANLPDLADIKASTATLQADLGNLSGVLNTIVTTSAVDVSGTSLDAIKTAVETIDNAIDGNYLNVNANIAGTDFVGGAGAVNAGTLRTTLATDDSSLGILEAIRAELVTGTQTIAGTVTVAVPAALGVVSNGTVGGSQRVTLANDSDGRVAVVPSKDAYLSHVYIDLDAAGDNPTTNTEVIAAGGASTKLVIYGIQGSIVGSAAAAAGNWYLSDGNTSAATTLWTGRAQGTTNTQFELTFPYGVALTTNTALKVTSTEAANNIFINAVVYYRTEAV